MLDDSHEWVLFCAGRDLGKSTCVRIFHPIPERTERAYVQPVIVTSVQPMGHGDKAWAKKLQDRISKSLSGKRRATWEKELGYTLADLRSHLERQFVKGMTWDNYAGHNEWRAQNVWVVDHIVPKALFTKEQSARAFCLSNLRPLWATQNMRKAAQRTHLL